MKLNYDPAAGEAFWEAVSHLPGYPAGLHHPIRQMLFESDALLRLSDVLAAAGARRDQPLMVVWDATPMRRAGEDLKALIAALLTREGWQLRLVTLQPDPGGQVLASMTHVETVRAALQTGCTLLSVGSGVVTDIAKHGSHLYQQETGEHIPYVVYQTANSVSAFTSNMAPLFVDGVKRTLPSRYPDALVCDLETLRDAPHEMTAAGVGDMLAPYVSLPDWYLAHQLGMDAAYTPLAENLLGDIGGIYLAEAEGIRRGRLESVAVLAKTIALGGLAMSLSHATTPLSGFEHVMSHLIDLQNELRERPLAPHGSQVALATVIGARLYRHFLDTFDPAELNIEQCYPPAHTMEQVVRGSFAAVDPSGKAGAECWADYRKKLEAWRARRADLQSALRNWHTLRGELEKRTCTPQQLLRILEAVGAPLRWDALNPPCSEDQVRFAFFNAPLMRKRLTIGDVLIFFGWDRRALWEQVKA